MGLGNGNKNYGNKGSNYAYEYASLNVLNKILVALGGGTPPISKTATTIRTGTSGIQTTPAVYSASFFNASNVKASIDGSDLNPGESISFSADSEGKLGPIDYDPDTTAANAGDLLIALVE